MDLETEHEQWLRQKISSIQKQQDRIEENQKRMDLRMRLMADNIASALHGILDKEELQIAKDILEGKYESKEIGDD